MVVFIELFCNSFEQHILQNSHGIRKNLILDWQEFIVIIEGNLIAK